MQGDGCLGSSDDSQTDSKDFSLSDTEGEYILFFLLCFVIFYVVLTSLKKNTKKHLSGWGDCPSWGQPILSAKGSAETG